MFSPESYNEADELTKKLKTAAALQKEIKTELVRTFFYIISINFLVFNIKTKK